jgi:hypothetical protein
MRFSPFAAILTAAALTAPVAWAQEESTNRVAAQTDWSVFVENDPQECWGVSAPKQTVNTRDGREVSVQRGDILLFVSYRPSAGVNGEISFTPGYVFSSGSTVTLEVGEASFQLFTDGEWAWPASAADDARIMTEMKRGTTAVLTGLSSRGTQTKDTFSLLGFTAVAEEAERRCAN